jgi:hypothetical protein
MRRVFGWEELPASRSHGPGQLILRFEITFIYPIWCRKLTMLEWVVRAFQCSHPISASMTFIHAGDWQALVISLEHGARRLHHSP